MTWWAHPAGLPCFRRAQLAAPAADQEVRRSVSGSGNGLEPDVHPLFFPLCPTARRKGPSVCRAGDTSGEACPAAVRAVYRFRSTLFETARWGYGQPVASSISTAVWRGEVRLAWFRNCGLPPPDRLTRSNQLGRPSRGCPPCSRAYCGWWRRRGSGGSADAHGGSPDFRERIVNVNDVGPPPDQVLDGGPGKSESRGAHPAERLGSRTRAGAVDIWNDRPVGRGPDLSERGRPPGPRDFAVLGRGQSFDD